MANRNGGAGPRGICLACSNAIAIGGINITRAFRCPHCGEVIRASRRFRALLNVVFYGLATIPLIFTPIPILLRIPIWFFLAFVFAFIYVFVGKRLFVLRLERYEEFQSLNLLK